MGLNADADADDLAVVQAWMQSALLDPHAIAGPLSRSVETVVADAPRLTARACLAIYRRSYVLRLHECMVGQFPALRHALGPELFDGFVADYLRRCPSTSPTLADLGARLGDFLDDTRPDRRASPREWWPDMLVELARFEFAITEVFDEIAGPCIQIPDLESIAVTPVLRLFSHRFPIAAYHRSVGRGEAPELPLPEPSHALLVRHDHRVGCFELQPAQHDLLVHLRAGLPLRDAMFDTAARHEIEPTRLDAMWRPWRARWIETGVLLPRG